MDIASLGLRIDNGQAVQATQSLDDLAAAGARAEASTQKLTTITGQQAEYLSRVYGLTAAQVGATVEVAAAQERAAASAGVHGIQLGRLNMELGTLIGRLTGVATPLTRFSAMLGGAVVGYGSMIAVLAGVVGAIEVIEKMAGYDREAAKAQEELNKQTEHWYDIHSRGIAGEQLEQLDALAARIVTLQAEYAKLSSIANASKDQGTAATEGSILFGALEQSKADDAAAKLQHLQQVLAALNAEIEKIRSKAWMSDLTQSVSEEADMMKFGLASPKMIEQMAQQMASFKQQAQDFANAGQTAAALEMARAYHTLSQAFSDVGKSEDEATKRAAELVKESDRAFAALDRAAAEDVRHLDESLRPGDTKEAEIHRQAMAIKDRADAQEAENAALLSGAAARADYQANLTAELQTLEARQTLMGADLDKRLEEIERLREATVAHERITRSMQDEANAARRAMQDEANAARRAQEEQDKLLNAPFKSAIEGIQRDFGKYFEDIFSGGKNSAEQFWLDFKNLALRTFAEIASANILNRALQSGSGLAAMLGMSGASTPGASTAGNGTVTIGGITLPAPTAAQLPSQGPGAMGYASAAGIGVASLGMAYGIGQSSGSSTTGALGGAAAGALGGAEIGSIIPGIGTAVGAVVGGLAGMVTGFLGAQKSAEDLARAMMDAEDKTAASLADWQEQITKTAGDQFAAEQLDLKVKYDEIVATIEQTEAGKKMEAQRNADLATAAKLYAENAAEIQGTDQALRGFTGDLNDVTGYKLAEQIYNYTPGITVGGSTGPASGNLASGMVSGSGQPSVITVQLMLDGKVAAQTVVKNLQQLSQAQFGTTDKWSEVVV